MQQSKMQNERNLEMLLRKVATISDKLKAFIQSGNYEIFILRLMNESKTIFPGQYNRHKLQSHSECDFYDVDTLEKYEAKLPFDKKEGELICSNNSNLKEWISFMMREEEEFGDKIIIHRGQYTVDSLRLYRTLEKRLNDVKADEHAIFFFPYPITFDMEPVGDEAPLYQMVSDILSALFRELKRNGVVGNRNVYAIYPTMDEKFALRCLNNDSREYVSCNDLDEIFTYRFALADE